MKIAIFHELPFGGARDSIYYFGEILAKNGMSVDLYYTSEKEDEKKAPFFKEIYYFKFNPAKWKGNNWKLRLTNDTLDLYRLNRLHKKIAERINAKNYSLVFVHGSQYIEAPFILSHLAALTVFYCHDPNYRIIYEKVLSFHNRKLNYIKRAYEKINRLLRKHLDKQNISKAKLLLTNSFFAKDIVLKTYGRDSRVAYPGVDVKFFSPGSAAKDIDIFYIGSHEKIDGFSLLKKAMKKMSRNIILKTKMPEDGWIKKEIIRDYYRRSKIVVCLAINEPFGSVPLEAMACGVPVIAVNEGGYKETVMHKVTGYLIARNASQLKNGISKMLNNKGEREKMGESARKYAVDTWSWNIRGKELFDILTQYSDYELTS